YEKARADIQKALALDSPDRPRYSYAKVHRFLGKIYLKIGKEQDAKKEFNKAIMLYTDKIGSKNPKDVSRAYNSRGRCYFNLEEYGRAISDLEKVIALNAPSYPKKCRRVYPMALKNLGVVYWKIGKREKANEYFKKAMKLFEEREERYYSKEIEKALESGDVLKLLILHPCLSDGS
ncbi:MAG: tetratricopeptide repeat protein, partial [Armatimonadetes bacterium]|nr:tetratricopeptide repeat protein [Armatimonadota bacterium]